MLTRGCNNQKDMITSDLALYYLTLGADEFKSEEKTRKTLRSITDNLELQTFLSDKDKQELWEVVNYLEVKSWTTDLWNMGNSLPADCLGHYSLVREWDNELVRFNRALLYRSWGRIHNYGKEPKWDEFTAFYQEYKTFLGREDYLFLEDKYVMGRLKSEEWDADELPEGSKVYSVSTIIKFCEDSFPELVAPKGGTLMGNSSFLRLINNVSEGLSSFEYSQFF